MELFLTYMTVKINIVSRIKKNSFLDDHLSWPSRNQDLYASWKTKFVVVWSFFVCQQVVKYSGSLYLSFAFKRFSPSRYVLLGRYMSSWLYKELCRVINTQSLEIASPLMLLLCAYDKFSIVALQVYQLLNHWVLGIILFIYYFFNKIWTIYNLLLIFFTHTRWSGVLPTSEQSTNVLLTYRQIFDR